MAKRFRLRICRAIATTLQSCRSKDPSILPQDPVPSFPKISALHFSPNHPSSAFISIGDAQPLQFKWQKEDKWHVVAKIHHPRHKTYTSAASDPPPSSRRRLKKKKKNLPTRIRLSTSSADSGWFSSDAAAAAAAVEEEKEEETETLVSTSPNSSSEFNHLHSIRESHPWPHRRTKKRTSHRTKRAPAPESDTPARLSMFKKLIPCTVDGKVKESFAIVKKSEDPYEDFKSSMMDMILEKQMFEQKDLEQLLQCFLSLNSRHYHGVIVDAFAEIWGAIFSPAGSEPIPHQRRPVSRLASS